MSREPVTLAMMRRKSSYAFDQGISLAAAGAARLPVLNSTYDEADSAALESYGRARGGGAKHVVALNIAVAVWFCRCPHVDAGSARGHVSRLVESSSTAIPRRRTSSHEGAGPTEIVATDPAGLVAALVQDSQGTPRQAGASIRDFD
jgi:hypothetical protein